MILNHNFYQKIQNNTLIKPNYKVKKFDYKRKINQSTIFQEINALIKRLYLQVYRKPSSILAGIIQPLLWLILFGSLFENAPIYLFNQSSIKYLFFLSSGIIIFTGFTASINGGLPIIFDREFGFFNRIIVSPLNYKSSILISLIIYIWSISCLQIIGILIFSFYILKNTVDINSILLIINICTLIIFCTGSLSIYMSFILPGHIEFLAFTVIINLPTLFSSTALAPLHFMPYWLQMIACINPLTYAIEIVRYIYINKYISYNFDIIKTIWFNLNIKNSIIILVIINIISFQIIKRVLKYKYN
uniref:ABC transmembrane type-2 domain-containing protein n=1 Tax=Thuretia quercifolia TaxID=189650 RepID=A0A1Z1MKT6_9FLOR|nr:hypothetical protein [Thuretia quercifolia]ARW66489.1 hypothetical protein [Thuretia quercifolia]